MSTGVPQSYYIDEFSRDGIMFEGAAGPPDYLANAIALWRHPLYHYRALPPIGNGPSRETIQYK